MMNKYKKIIGACLAGTLLAVVCILMIRGTAAENMAETAFTEPGSNGMSRAANQVEPESRTITVSQAEADGQAADSQTEAGYQTEAASQAEANHAEPGSMTDREGEPDMEERVVYQPDFYYEPLSEDVKGRIYGLSYKEDATVPYGDLRYVRVRYINFNGKDKTGEIICNKAIAQDLAEIFYELYLAQYPIEQIRLIDEYAADDTLSMKDNNTSCFNYRVVSGSSKLSKHALGLAIDVNPFYNPYVNLNTGGVSPEESAYYADRTKTFSYKIDENDLCYQLFTQHGFFWGGNWKVTKDYQHFQKEI